MLVSSLVVLFHGQWLRACIDEGPGRVIHLEVVAIPAQLVVLKVLMLVIVQERNQRGVCRLVEIRDSQVVFDLLDARLDDQ
jgi:hypothetical protein